MNITFNSIYIFNFLSIKEATVSLCDQGFVTVIGQNNQPIVPQSNGSGKSSIFDAIFWTLTGETLRGTSDIVNENAGNEGCECVLEFTDGQHFYKIKRAKGHISLGNSCYFYVDGEVLSDQIKKSQEMIEHYLPLVASSEVLGSIILLGQGLPFKFSSFSPTKRKDMLELMSGSTTEIDKFKSQLNSKEAQVSQEESLLNKEISKYSGEIAGQTQLIDSLNKQIETYTNKNISEEISKIESEIVSYQESLKDFEEKPELDKELDHIKEMASNVMQMIYQVKASDTSAKQQLNSIASGNCPTCGRPYEVTEEQIKLKESLQNKINEYAVTLANLQSKQKTLEDRQFEIREERNIRNNTYNSLNFKIRDCQSKLNEYQKYEIIINDLRQQIETANQKIKIDQVQINDLNQKSKDYKEIIECIDYIIRQLSRDFKGYVLQDAIDFMSLRAKAYGKYLFSDKEINIKLNGNKINIMIDDRQYENLSGGERQRTDLAVQFALRDMLSISSGFSCNLLVLDEAFDNLDAQGSTSLINLITSEFSDVDSVFVITHHSEIDIPYDKQIIVTKEKDGNSYIS